MVSFNCQRCQDVVKKPKVVSHAASCGSSSFSCVDCMKVFTLETIKDHTSCVSETSKYQGKWSGVKKGPGVQQNESSRKLDSSDEEEDENEKNLKQHHQAKRRIRSAMTFSDTDMTSSDDDDVAPPPAKKAKTATTTTSAAAAAAAATTKTNANDKKNKSVSKSPQHGPAVPQNKAAAAAAAGSKDKDGVALQGAVFQYLAKEYPVAARRMKSQIDVSAGEEKIMTDKELEETVRANSVIKSNFGEKATFRTVLNSSF